jgi:hypothetical protein
MSSTVITPFFSFKDRHWLDREVPQISEAIARNAAPCAPGHAAAAAATTLLVECGCGVGNAMFPLCWPPTPPCSCAASTTGRWTTGRCFDHRAGRANPAYGCVYR